MTANTSALDEVLDAPHEMVVHQEEEAARPEGFLICFDVETTGLNPYGGDEILSLTAIDGEGNVLYDGMFKPEHATEWPMAQKTNGISPADVDGAPSIASELDALNAIFKKADTLLGYNVYFDLDFAIEAGIEIRDGIRIEDAMAAFQRCDGDSKTGRRYKGRRQKLSTAARKAGFDFAGKQHTSCADAKATLAVYRWCQAWEKEFAEKCEAERLLTRISEGEISPSQVMRGDYPEAGWIPIGDLFGNSGLFFSEGYRVAMRIAGRERALLKDLNAEQREEVAAYLDKELADLQEYKAELERRRVERVALEAEAAKHRPEFLASIAAGKLEAYRAIGDNAPEISGMAVAEFLAALPSIPESDAAGMMDEIGIEPSKTVGELSVKRRQKLKMALKRHTSRRK